MFTKDYVLADCLKEATLHLVLRLRGGCQEGQSEIGLAAGGLVHQTIVKDSNDPYIWEPDSGTILNVQILNSLHFREVTGMEPPASPITASTYAQHGFPYYQIYDEKLSGIKGNFEAVKSVNELDTTVKPSTERNKVVAEVSKTTYNPVVLLDSKGNRIGFRTVSEMEKAVREEFGFVRT